jgi:hypothetical protein
MPNIVVYAMFLAPPILAILMIIVGIVLRLFYLNPSSARKYGRSMKWMKFDAASACVMTEGKMLHKLNCILRVLFPISTLPMLAVLLFMPGLLVEPLLAILR